MKQSIADRLALFSDNSQVARGDFRWAGGGGQTGRLMALIYALEGEVLDSAAVRRCHDLIKADTRMFSEFRGITSLAVAAKLSLSADPERLFTDVMAAHGRLREAKFSSSPQLTIAAYLVAAGTERHNFKKVADRAKVFNDGMRGFLWFLAGQDDSIFSAMLGLTDMPASVGVARVEELHQRLRPEFSRWSVSRNNLQTLAQVLTLGGKSDDALCCLLDLNRALRVQRVRLDRQYTLPALGILSLLSVDDSAVLVDDILAARDYLRAQRGFRGLSGQELLLFATAVISSVYAEECVGRSSAAGAGAGGSVVASTAASVVNIIIAQQIAVMIAIMAAASASAAAAASG